MKNEKEARKTGYIVCATTIKILCSYLGENRCILLGEKKVKLRDGWIKSAEKNM